MQTHAAAFALLLGATACMGIGFGLTVPAINVLAARCSRAVSTWRCSRSTPCSASERRWRRCSSRCSWRSAPGGGCRSRSACLLLALTIWSLSLPLAAAGAGAEAHGRALAPLLAVRRVRALLRRRRDDERQLGDPLHEGRPARGRQPRCAHAHAVLGGGDRRPVAVRRGRRAGSPRRRTFGLLPWVIALAFVATALVPSSTPALGTAAFGLAGLGCSALLPLTISLGRIAASPGHLIACYQLGYGIAAFGVAPLHDSAGLGLRGPPRRRRRDRAGARRAVDRDRPLGRDQNGPRETGDPRTGSRAPKATTIPAT